MDARPRNVCGKGINRLNPKSLTVAYSTSISTLIDVPAAAAAGDEGAEALDAVGQTLGGQELKGPIDRGRLGRTFAWRCAGQQVVGFDRMAGPQQQLEHPLARAGQALAAGGALIAGGRELVDEGRAGKAGRGGMSVGAVVRHRARRYRAWPRGASGGPSRTPSAYVILRVTGETIHER